MADAWVHTHPGGIVYLDQKEVSLKRTLTSTKTGHNAHRLAVSHTLLTDCSLSCPPLFALSMLVTFLLWMHDKAATKHTVEADTKPNDPVRGFAENTGHHNALFSPHRTVTQ